MRTTNPTPATGWRALWRAYPRAVAALVALLAVLIATDVVLAATRARYWREVDRLRAGMTEAERRRADLLIDSEQHRFRTAVELLRRQARGDRELHLAIEVDSGRMILERDGVVLREMTVEIGPARVVGTPPDTLHIVAPRGTRTIVRVIAPDEPWALPPWVHADRGVPVPDDATPPPFGAQAVVLSGGTVLYARPSRGALADTAYVMPGAVRVSADDLRAIAPNLTPGMSVYFY